MEYLGNQKIRNLGSGSLGFVAKFKKPKYTSNAAVKIVIEDESLVNKMHSWAHLHHSNLVPLLAKECIFTLLTICFVRMIFHKYHKILKRSINWSRTINDGLAYFLVSKYYHLDIKVDNTLILESN